MNEKELYYTVDHLQDNTYQVIANYWDDDLVDKEKLIIGGWVKDVAFQGSISDCEAWIKLREGGYLS
jgi:hypothetical protein